MPFTKLFQSMLPVRGATLVGCSGRVGEHISIHAPRAGSDLTKLDLLEISIVFQSMLPVRGATLVATLINADAGISIHAPRAGSDPAFW